MPAGPVAALVGFESREEDYTDGRDPRIDGRMLYGPYWAVLDLLSH